MSQLTDEEFEQAKKQIADMMEDNTKPVNEFMASLSEEELKRISKAFERIARENAEIDSQFFRFLCGGLIGVDFLFIQGYLSAKLDVLETLALYTFAASLPFLVLYLMLSSLFSHEFCNFESGKKLLFTSSLLAIISMVNYVGIALAIFHFSINIGACFVFSSFIALFILALVYLPVHRK